MKTYVKPDVYYENFELSQHIATGCSVITNSNDVSTCYSKNVTDDMMRKYAEQQGGEFYGTGGTVFGTGNSNCVYEIEDYCYTNDSDKYFVIFTS